MPLQNILQKMPSIIFQLIVICGTAFSAAVTVHAELAVDSPDPAAVRSDREAPVLLAQRIRGGFGGGFRYQQQRQFQQLQLQQQNLIRQRQQQQLLQRQRLEQRRAQQMRQQQLRATQLRQRRQILEQTRLRQRQLLEQRRRQLADRQLRLRQQRIRDDNRKSMVGKQFARDAAAAVAFSSGKVFASSRVEGRLESLNRKIFASRLIASNHKATKRTLSSNQATGPNKSISGVARAGMKDGGGKGPPTGGAPNASASAVSQSKLQLEKIKALSSGAVEKLRKLGSYGGGLSNRQDWPILSGILRDARRNKGYFGVGSATREQSEVAGKAWVGAGFKTASDGKTLISSDGLRQYRPPSRKESGHATTGVQSNFERREFPHGNWTHNAHLDIIQ